MKFLTLFVAYTSMVGQCLAATEEKSLDGYAFDCGGLLIGFEGDDKIHCMNGSDVPCGDYTYDGDSILSGYSTLTGPFSAWNVDKKDGILVAFQSDLGVSCNAVSLNWRRYSGSRFLGLKCPIQNEVPQVSFQDNHFSLGMGGDAALRSPLELTASGRRLVRDMYGVYQWFDDESIRFYLGPQQGQRMLILDGKLTIDGELYVEDYHPPGPCLHDGSSALTNTTELPITPRRSRRSRRPEDDDEDNKTELVQLRTTTTSTTATSSAIGRFSTLTSYLQGCVIPLLCLVGLTIG